MKQLIEGLTFKCNGASTLGACELEEPIDVEILFYKDGKKEPKECDYLIGENCVVNNCEGYRCKFLH